MTERELRKLTRVELLEMLLALSKENEALTQQVEDLKAVAKRRRIDLEKAGSIAEAAISVGGVFQAAQAAADLYLDSVRAQEEEYGAKAQRMLEETQRRCDAMLAEADRQIDQRRQKLFQQIESLGQTVPGLDGLSEGCAPEGEAPCG